MSMTWQRSPRAKSTFGTARSSAISDRRRALHAMLSLSSTREWLHERVDGAACRAESIACQQAAIELDDARHDHRCGRGDRNAGDRRRRAGARARTTEKSWLKPDADFAGL